MRAFFPIKNNCRAKHDTYDGEIKNINVNILPALPPIIYDVWVWQVLVLGKKKKNSAPNELNIVRGKGKKSSLNAKNGWADKFCAVIIWCVP